VQRVIKPEAGECRISSEMGQEKDCALLQTAGIRPNLAGSSGGL